MEILKAIGRGGYVFFSLNEALSVNTLLLNRKEFSVKYLSEGDVVAQANSLLGKPYWRALMNQICHGAHNWAPCVTYLDAVGYDPSDPQASLLKGEIALKYLGMYYFDKERSEKACYVSFKKRYDDRLYI